MSTTNDRVLIATRKGLFEARKRAGEWSLSDPALAGKNISYAMRDPRSKTVWASLDHGHWGVKLAKSTDDGASYTEATPPKYPEDTGKSARYYWVIQSGLAANPGRLWIGTEPGGLFRSDDGGESWELNRPLWDMCVEHKWTGGGRDEAGIHSICVDPRDGNHIIIAISCSGVLETKDGGATWAYRCEGMRKVTDPGGTEDFGHDPHFISMCAAHPDVLWQANHCGVYRSDNGAASWTDLSKPPWVDFGFPATAHPTDPNVGWIVPMQSDNLRLPVENRLVVLRTDDAGETWQEQASGLPAPSFDFPFRHGIDVSPGGGTLVMGTTSGNLYTSENGGRTWATLSSSLPPIYSVRFA